MNISQDLEKIINDGIAEKSIIDAIYDQLDIVECEFMIGHWRGIEIKTGHPIEGLLEISEWYGKFFKNTEEAYPLIHLDSDGHSLFAIDPKYIPLKHPIDLVKKVGKYLPVIRILKKIQTKDSKARLRMIEHRGKISSAMVYDEKPINDVFRKIDKNRVLGVMDFKAIPDPYYFVLIRDDQARNRLNI